MVPPTPVKPPGHQSGGAPPPPAPPPLEPMSGFDQCAKWRVPVRYIVMPAAFAASIDSWSRTEPPG